MCWIIFWSVYFLIWAYICWSVYQTFYLSILWKGKGRFGKEKLRWRHKGGASLKEWDVSTTSGTQQHNITNNKRNSNKMGLSQGAPRKHWQVSQRDWNIFIPYTKDAFPSKITSWWTAQTLWSKVVNPVHSVMSLPSLWLDSQATQWPDSGQTVARLSGQTVARLSGQKVARQWLGCQARKWPDSG